MRSRNTYLIYAWDGWHFLFGDCQRDAERAARYSAQEGSRKHYPHAYLFTLPDGIEVAYNEFNQPLNLPLAAADSARLFASNGRRAWECVSPQSRPSTEEVLTQFAEHFAPEAVAIVTRCNHQPA